MVKFIRYCHYCAHAATAYISVTSICWFLPAGKIFTNRSMTDSLINVHNTFSKVAIHLHGIESSRRALNWIPFGRTCFFPWQHARACPIWLFCSKQESALISKLTNFHVKIFSWGTHENIFTWKFNTWIFSYTKNCGFTVLNFDDVTFSKNTWWYMSNFCAQSKKWQIVGVWRSQVHHTYTHRCTCTHTHTPTSKNLYKPCAYQPVTGTWFSNICYIYS